MTAAIRSMTTLNQSAAMIGRAFGTTAATDVTGFGLLGHAWNVARGSGVGLRIVFDALPVHDGFLRLAAAGVTTGCTAANRENVEASLASRRTLSPAQADLLVDPQTSGGLLLSAPAAAADALLAALLAGGHRAAAVGEVVAGPPRLEVV